MRPTSNTDLDVRQVRAILARWDAIAYAQLAAEAARLSDLVDDFRERAYRAEDDAVFWEDSFRDLQDQIGGRAAVGITPDCRFVAIAPDCTFPAQPPGSANTTN